MPKGFDLFYSWLIASDVFEQLESTTLLMKQIKDWKITQVAQARKIIAEGHGILLYSLDVIYI